MLWRPWWRAGPPHRRAEPAGAPRWPVLHTPEVFLHCGGEKIKRDGEIERKEEREKKSREREKGRKREKLRNRKGERERTREKKGERDRENYSDQAYYFCIIS